MSWNVVSLDDVQPQAWKNGGGTTRELLAWPLAVSWQLRLSVAEVEADGPFSRFDGVQRWFAVLSGAGVQLVVDGLAHKLTAASDPLAFDGGARTTCTLLGGATQDFNLMARGASPVLRRVRAGMPAAGAAARFQAVYAVAAPAVLRSAGHVLSVAPHTLAWRLEGAEALVQGDDALWMEVSA